MSCRTLCESVASTTTSMVEDSMVTSCQTLCASSVTDLVDTENTPFIDRWEHCIWYLLMGLFLLLNVLNLPLLSHSLSANMSKIT